MKKFGFVLVALLTIVPAATANLTPLGDPQPIGSWAQRFEESGVGSFDLLAVVWVSPATTGFEAPVFRNFTDPSWGNAINTKSVATATGSALNWMQFDLAFLPDTNVPISFMFYAFAPGVNTPVDSALASWNGGGWSFRIVQDAMTRTSLAVQTSIPVPAPAAAGLVALGLGLVGWFRRRFA